MADRHQRRIPVIVVALFCILGLLSACAGVDTPGESPQGGASGSPGETPLSGELTLAYTANDSLNPYLAKTKTNQELAGLLYDSLILLGENMTPIYRLAKEIKVKGTNVTVTLNEAYFSDGSRVTAEDVLASMEAAIEAENMSYGQDFSVVKEKTVTQSGNLSLKLSHQDAYFINFLDFPVYKKGSEEQQNDDNKDLPPMGSGRYVYHEESGEYWLTANQNWLGGAVGIPRIQLLNLPDSDAIDHAVQVGTVDWCYSDLGDNTFPNMNGISLRVPLMNLVYLGANMHSGFMSIRNVRMGVSAAIDRTDLAENAYFGVATPAAGPYPAGLTEADGLQSLAPTDQGDTAGEYFDKAGFTKVNKDGYRTNGSNTLSIKIIYNKENTARESVARLLTTQLKAVGCKVTTSALSFSSYQAAIRNGHYDIYIGEMAIPDNLDLYPLLNAGGLLTLDVSAGGESSGSQGSTQGADTSFEVEEGVNDPAVAARAAYRYHTGKGSLTEMLSCIGEQLPIIPLCHRQGMLIYSERIQGTPTPLPGDPFHGIENCKVQ